MLDSLGSMALTLCGPWIGNFGITCELFRTAESQVLPQTSELDFAF